jgi:hypothetical protein
VPTLHTIGVPSRLKFRIGSVVNEDARRQTSRRLVDDACRIPDVIVVVEQFVGLYFAGSRRGFGAVRPCLFEKRVDVGRRDGVVVETAFQAVEPEGCQHQQPRDERNEQPGHMAK